MGLNDGKNTKRKGRSQNASEKRKGSALFRSLKKHLLRRPDVFCTVRKKQRTSSSSTLSRKSRRQRSPEYDKDVDQRNSQHKKHHHHHRHHRDRIKNESEQKSSEQLNKKYRQNSKKATEKYQERLQIQAIKSAREISKSTEKKDEAISKIGQKKVQKSQSSKAEDRRNVENTQKSTESMRKKWRSMRSKPSSSPSTSSLRSAREKVKAFFSRPIQEASMLKIVEKIRKRDKFRKESLSKEKLIPETPLRRADQEFPQIKRISDLEMRDKKSPSFKKKELSAELIKVKNKDNKGKLFDENGVPFWNNPSIIREGQDENEPTDEDLPMDSELLLEVQAGKRTLVKMPQIRIVMDPYASMDYLKSRDKTFFANEVIFSNTVRSMVNLNDEITDREIANKKKRKLQAIPILLPSTITLYNEDHPWKNKRALLK